MMTSDAKTCALMNDIFHRIKKLLVKVHPCGAMKSSQEVTCIREWMVFITLSQRLYFHHYQTLFMTLPLRNKGEKETGIFTLDFDKKVNGAWNPYLICYDFF